jgi:hypothetical protein
MEQLLTDFNATESTIGHQIVSNYLEYKNSISQLEKYDLLVIETAKEKVIHFKDGLFDELMKRRTTPGYDKGDIENMRCGFNIADKCIQEINELIYNKTIDELNIDNLCDDQIVKGSSGFKQLYYIFMGCIIVCIIIICVILIAF